MNHLRQLSKRLVQSFNMSIDLTKEEYVSLLKALSIASWVHSTLEEEVEDFQDDLEPVIQKLMSKYKDFKAYDDVFYDEAVDKYFPSEEIEQDALSIVQTYEEIAFWDHLTRRMSERDLILEYGNLEVQNMDPIERMEIESTYLAKYNEEFIENDISRLRIVGELEEA